MKKLISLPVFIIVLAFFTMTSCEKDKSPEELIIGTWAVQDYTEIIYFGGVKSESYTYYLKTDEMSFQFVEGGSGIQYKDGEMYQVFEWKIEGNSLLLTYGETIQDWSFTIDGGTITMSASGNGTTDSGTAYTYDVIYTALKK